MKKLTVTEEIIGKKLAKAVNYNGNVLLDAGTELTREYLDSLVRRKIPYIYADSEIDDEESDLLEIIIESLDEYNPEKQPVQRFEELLLQLGETADSRATDYLTDLISNPRAGMEKEEFISVILDTLQKLPPNQYLGAVSINLLTRKLSAEIRKKAYLLACREGDKNELYPLLRASQYYYREIPASAASEFLRSYYPHDIVEQVTILLSEVEVELKVYLLEILKPFAEKSQIDILYDRFVKISVTSLEKETDLSAELRSRAAQLPPAVLTSYKKNLEGTTALLNDFRSGRKILESEIERLSAEMLDQILKKPELLPDLLTLCNQENYLLSHSLNVTYLASVLGKRLGLSQAQLQYLATAALVHDAGMMKFSPPVWNEPRVLSISEKIEIQKHTLMGMEALLSNTKFSKDICYVAYQHHEYADGSGYPRARILKEINQYSQIIGPCDVFTAMISPRKYRPAHTLSAVSSFFEENVKLFNPEIVGELMKLAKEKLGIFEITQDPEKDAPTDEKPVENSAKKTVSAPAAPLSEISGVKILLLDDDRFVTGFLSRFLKKKGAIVTVFNHPGDFMDIMETSDADVFIIDISLGPVSGFDVIAEVRKCPATASKPVVIISGLIDRDTIISAKSLSVTQFLAKPFEDEQLVPRIMKAIRG